MAVAESDELPTSLPHEEVEALSTPVLYRRDAELTATVESRVPLLLVTGDSGIGKSELLRVAQEATLLLLLRRRGQLEGQTVRFSAHCLKPRGSNRGARQ